MNEGKGGRCYIIKRGVRKGRKSARVSEEELKKMKLEEVIMMNEESIIRAGGVVWEDLTVELKEDGQYHQKKLLNMATGSALPGRLLALMGPSGSGKTTLLRSLSGIFPPFVVIVKLTIAVYSYILDMCQ